MGIGESMGDKVNYNTGNYDKYMSKNALKRKLVQNLNNKIVAQVKDFATEIRASNGNDNDPIRILDAGCGEGFIDRILLNSIFGIELTGLEYTAEAIAIAKKMNPDVTYIQGDITDMHFNDGTFDVVLCTEVLEHIPDPAAALKELIRVCRSKILITVPHEPWFCMGNLLAFNNVARLGNPVDHVNHWRKSTFIDFLGGDKACWTVSTSFPWLMASTTIQNQTTLQDKAL